jgi:hypothetical protein
MLESASHAVAVDGKVYAIGADGLIQEYDPAALTWVNRTIMPNPTDGGVVAYQNRIYVIGTSFNEWYDVATGVWSSGAAMPTYRIGVQANVVGNRIFMVGGLANTESGTIININEAYDPATNTWSTKAAIPTPVYLYASAVVDNKIYIIGGSSEPPNVMQNLVQIYDPENDSWTTGAAMPIAVRYAAAAATTGVYAPKRIYVFGGLQSGLGLNLTQIYNPETDTWAAGAEMPTSRYNLGAAAVNDTIYVLGGVLLPSYAFPKEPLKTNEIYLPVGYSGPTPAYWQPTSTPAATATSLPTIRPTISPTNSATETPQNNQPTTTPVDHNPSAYTVLIVTIVAAVAVAIAAAAVFLKKIRRH